MGDRDLQRTLAKVAQLTLGQRAKLHSALAQHDGQGLVLTLIDGRPDRAAPVCRNCPTAKLVRNGQANGLQRYKRRGGGKTFNALTCSAWRLARRVIFSQRVMSLYNCLMCELPLQ